MHRFGINLSMAPRAPHRWMRKAWTLGLAWFGVLSLLCGSGCGLEVLFLGIPTGGTHKAPEVKPMTRLQGKATGLGGATLTLRAGRTQLLQTTTSGDGRFDLELPKDTDFFNLTLEARRGSVLLRTIVPQVKQGETTKAGEIDVTSTASVLILEAALSVEGLATINYPYQGMTIALERIKKDIGQKDALKTFRSMVEKLHAQAKTQPNGPPMFVSPEYRPGSKSKEPPQVIQSALNSEAIGGGVDYCEKDTFAGCGDGSEATTQGFDAALAAAIQVLAIPKCSGGKELRLVFTVTLSPDAKDGNCSTVKQFKHAKRYGGTSCEKCKVYFTGGIHKDSGLTDPKLAQQFGNWEPNTIQMYDDGTNGDLVAGDGVWTLTFAVPAPERTGQSCKAADDCGERESCHRGKCYKALRIGYKYTFGLNGDVWGGTEEFPGNQRLLEVIDNNNDGFVARHDNFADETANKDRVNTLQKKGATGMICFAQPSQDLCESDNPKNNHPDCGCKTDQDGDGVPDAQERAWDQDQDCKPDGYRVFANAQPFGTQCK